MYLVARGCSLIVQTNTGDTALDVATEDNFRELAQFLTSASNLITNNDYSSLRSLCAPYSTSPFLSLNIARQLRYTTILAARHARRIHDDPSLHTPLDPFLLRLALLPSADNRSPRTESQVLRRILSYVGAGFDYAEAEPQAARMNRDARILAPRQQENVALTQTNAALTQKIAALATALAASSDDSGGPSMKRARS
jgi:hypothetical protein